MHLAVVHAGSEINGERSIADGYRQGLMRAKKEGVLIHHAKSNHAEAWMRCIEGVDASS
jgi:hypothetical protein